mmetsp:Transcript_14993/g.52633  ORF Transcript_14993/g.52633 Transcript_14993/m.52633 type:complete len:230 (-) Transcript_14993:1064-1753(-)
MAGHNAQHLHGGVDVAAADRENVALPHLDGHGRADRTSLPTRAQLFGEAARALFARVVRRREPRPAEHCPCRRRQAPLQAVAFDLQHDRHEQAAVQTWAPHWLPPEGSDAPAAAWVLPARDETVSTRHACLSCRPVVDKASDMLWVHAAARNRRQQYDICRETGTVRTVAVDDFHYPANLFALAVLLSSTGRQRRRDHRNSLPLGGVRGILWIDQRQREIERICSQPIS